MTQFKYTEIFIFDQIFLGPAGIWINHPLGEKAFIALLTIEDFLSLSGARRKEGIFDERL